MQKLSQKIDNIETKLASFSDKLAPLADSKVNSEVAQSDSTKCYCQAEINRLQTSVNEIRNILNNQKAPLLYDLVESVTGVIGLKEVVVSKHPFVKYTWALLFLFGIASTVFFIYRTGQEYLDEPTATKIKLDDSPGNSFPPIVICPSAWLDAEKAYSHGLSIDGLKYSLAYHTYLPASMQIDNITKAQEDFLSFYTYHNFTSLLDYYEKISIDLPVVYSLHEFANLSTAVKLVDEHSRFVRKIFKDNGICFVYTFHLPDFIWSSTATVAKLVDKTRNILGSDLSWWWQLGDHLDLFSTVIPGLYLPAFTKSNIFVGAKKFVTLDRPNDHCVSTVEADLSNYSSSYCTLDCQNKYYKKFLKCQIFMLSSVTNATQPKEYCHYMTKLGYNNWTLDEFLSNDGNDQMKQINEKCLRKCPQKCDRLFYQATLQWQQELFNNSDLINQSIDSYIELMVNSYFMYEGILTITEVPTYSFTQLINNVGGTLGLFVGGTIMTLAQFILFFVNYLCENGVRSKKVSTSDMQQK